jgi:2-polyprenyl-3-methyl-5-hydroxy-6-metoxy-1,4-benzoquinol methylase
VSQYPTIDDQKQFWDWHWQHWQERKTINSWKDKRHEMVLTFLRSLALDHPRILDLGCGPGWYTERLAQFGQTTGVDLSKEAISVAKSRLPQITFLAGDLYELPLPTEHFDVVVSQEVIDHVPDQVAFLNRAASVLKPGGYLILSCANKFVMDRLGDGEFPLQPAAHISRYLDAKGLKRLLRPYFDILRLTTILPIGHRGILRLINSHKLNSVLGFVIPPRYLEAMKERAGLGYTLIVLAQKKR